MLHIMPSWFLSANILFEFLFFIFAAAISYYAFSAYKLTNQRESKIFGWSFLFLAISHFALIIINSLFLSITQGGFRTLEFGDLMGIKNFMVASYVFFFILGLITITYMSLKIKSKKTYFLLIFLSIIILFCSMTLSLLIYSLASLLLLFITMYYFSEFIRTRNKNTLFVLIGFFMLLVTNLLLSIVTRYSLPSVYVLAYLTEVVGYTLIILSLINVLNYGKKKK